MRELINLVKIDEEHLLKWQKTINILTDIVDVPLGVLFSVLPHKIKVVMTNQSLENPFQLNQMIGFGPELYQKTIEAFYRHQAVPEHFLRGVEGSEDFSFFGYPIMTPDEKLWGVLGILDTSRRQYTKQQKESLLLYKEFIEQDIKILRLTEKLKDHKKQLDEQRGTILQQRVNFNSLFNNSPLFMMLVNEEGRIEDINTKGLYTKLTHKGEWVGKLGGEVVRCVHSFDEGGCGGTESCLRCPVRGSLNETLTTGQCVYQHEGTMMVQGEEGHEKHFILISTVGLTLPEGKNVLIYIEDISEHKKALEELEKYKS